MKYYNNNQTFSKETKKWSKLFEYGFYQKPSLNAKGVKSWSNFQQQQQQQQNEEILSLLGMISTTKYEPLHYRTTK